MTALTDKTRIELLRAHRHAGRDYQPGHVIGVAADQADWLCAIGVARPASTEQPTPAAPAATPKRPGNNPKEQ